MTATVRVPFYMPVDPLILSYATGIFDGEGTVSVSLITCPKAINGKLHRLKASITTTDFMLYDWLKLNFGGQRANANTANIRDKPAVRWHVYTAHAARFLEAIRPYSIIKASRIDVALKIRETLRNRGGKHTKVDPMTQEVFEQRESIRQSMLELNKRGINPSEHYSGSAPTLLTGNVAHAYLAGIIDAEGSISIVRETTTTRLQPHHKLRLRIPNTDPRLMSWLQSSYGGSVQHVQAKTINSRPSYVWYVSGRQAAMTIEKALPYLVIKSEHAHIGMKLRLLPRKHGPVMLEDGREHVILQREGLRQELLSLNTRGVVVNVEDRRAILCLYL